MIKNGPTGKVSDRTRAHNHVAENGPLVTVLICSYNAGEYLQRSLLSVLEQTYKKLEVILVDDGSTDGSVDFVDGIEDERLIVLRQENRGKPAALNRALDQMTGKYYAIHDADDLSHPTRIERQVEFLEREEDVAAVFCGHELLIGDRPYAPRFRAKNRAACKADIQSFRMPAHDPTGMYRVSMVRQIRYDIDLRIAQGYDYILRVGEQYPMAVIGECLYSYRIRWDSLTKGDPDKRVQYIKQVLRNACERRGLDFETHFRDRVQWPARNSAQENGLASAFIESVVDLRTAGRWWEAVRTGVACATLHPGDLKYYKPLIYTFLPIKVRQALRPSERTKPGSVGPAD